MVAPAESCGIAAALETVWVDSWVGGCVEGLVVVLWLRWFCMRKAVQPSHLRHRQKLHAAVLCSSGHDSCRHTAYGVSRFLPE